MHTKFLLAFALLVSTIFCSNIDTESPRIEPVSKNLKVRMPEWRPEIVEVFQDGTPRRVVFYVDNDDGGYTTVKRIEFYQNHQIMEETDLTYVYKDDPGFKAWNTHDVPHGASVRYYENGSKERIVCFNKGIFHGETKIFYPSGQLHYHTMFKHGHPEGKMVAYYENGNVLSEVECKDGEFNGSYVQYYENGEQLMKCQYVQGKAEGTSYEWYQNGAIKAETLFSNGELHSRDQLFAVMKYDENHAVIESQHFLDGVAHDSHIKYHENQRESYCAKYENGKLHGEEKWFLENGKLLGESRYIHGKKIGKHWKNYTNGVLAYLADYDQKGNLKQPICEFYDNQQKAAEYLRNINGNYEGEYCRWASNGQLTVSVMYIDGEYDGEFLAFYDSGNKKSQGFYKNALKNGCFQEWSKNGQQLFNGSFINGNKEGQFIENDEKGNIRVLRTFKQSLFDGDQKEWNQDKVLTLSACYTMGKKHGEFRKWNDQNRLVFEGAFECDLPIGDHITYFDLGAKQELIQYVKGQKDGKHLQYDESGNIRLEEIFTDNLLDGHSVTYYADKSKKSDRLFKSGQLVGVQKEFFPLKDGNQQLARVYVYNSQGQLDGEQSTFYQNGNLETVLNYDNGVLHGFKKHWDCDQNLCEEAHYVHGKLEGRYLQKDGEGREIIYHYKNNRREGLHEVYIVNHENKRLKALTAHYVNNQIDGVVTEFYPNGSVMSMITHVQGEKHGPIEVFHENGQKIMQFEYLNDEKHGAFNQYYPEGELYRTGSFDSGKKEGEEITYFTNGKINSIYRYKNGLLEGLSEHWNENGTCVFNAMYCQGVEHGVFRKYYDNGKMRLEQHFKRGKRDGVKKNYDSSGKYTESRYENGERVF